MPAERKKVLELQGVTAYAGPRYSMGLSDVSLCLASGEAAIVTVSKDERSTPLADLCCGLEDPAAGVVRFLDQPWSERSAAQMTMARGCIGRVWADLAWIGNLDMDENILLPQMHHTHRAADEVREQAKTLSQSFGLDDLPDTRPAWTQKKIRQKAQWVRAMMGTPELLLLEYPDDDADEADRVRFAAAVDRTRTRGAAVLWITSRPVRVLTDLPGAVRQAELTGGTLIWRMQENRMPNFQKG